MPLLTKKEKQEEIMKIQEMLDELEFGAAILPPGQWADETGLLIDLPTDEEFDWEGEDFPENAHVAVAYLLQLDNESEAQLTKYLLFSFINQLKGKTADELQLLRIVNGMNRQIRMGSFFMEKAEDGEQIVHYRLTVAASTDDVWDEGVLGEAIIEMSLYYDMMQEELDQLPN